MQRLCPRHSLRYSVGQPGCKTEVLKMSSEAELGPLNQSIGGAKGQIGRNMKNFAI